MIPPTTWEPTPADIAWQESWLRVLKDNGVWGVPMNQSAFKVNKTDKTFELTIGDPYDETNRRIAVVFVKLGYREKHSHINRIRVIDYRTSED